MVDPYIEKLAPEQCTLMKNFLLLGLPKASVVSEDLLKMSVSEMKLSLSSSCGIVTTTILFTYEPVHDKTNNLGFRPGPTQTSLYSHRRNPES